MCLCTYVYAAMYLYSVHIHIVAIILFMAQNSNSGLESNWAASADYVDLQISLWYRRGQWQTSFKGRNDCLLAYMSILLRAKLLAHKSTSLFELVGKHSPIFKSPPNTVHFSLKCLPCTRCEGKKYCPAACSLSVFNSFKVCGRDEGILL